MQTSRDQGATWRTSSLHNTAGTEFLRPGADELDAAELASDVLDTTYRAYLNGDDGTEAIPLIQVLVWEGSEPHGVPAATSSTGTDRQWQATGDLIAEIAGDIRSFEAEKKEHEAKAASAQLAITNAKDRLARVVNSAARMQMPQVTIAHRAGRSREWVRQTVG
ncbi:hypothetical protein [Streptomyces sp. NPDC047973]|uniref:hypothetical protein n=1 Tax=Streptomyces sp. NPDC047973 TaxID=3155383 RepID=UPI00341F29C7